MDKETILLQTKEQMNCLVNNLSFSNLSNSKEMFENFFHFLHYLNELPLLKVKAIQEEISCEPSFSELLENEQIPQEVYFFERKLRGGYIQELDGGYPIPEKMVRDIGLNHGDRVKVVSTKSIDGMNRHMFQIVEKSRECLENRVEHKYCFVERDFGEYIVRNTAEGEIRLNGVPHTFVLNSKDAMDFQLNAGDVIDIAYYTNRPNETIRAIWKHPSTASISAVLSKTSYSKKKPININLKEEKEWPITKELFQGKKILVVGATTREADFREVFEKLGVEFTIATGNEEISRLQSMIRKVDGVAIVTKELAHRGSICAVKLCKEENVPFSSTENNGIQSVLLCVEKVLNRGECTVTSA